MPLQTFEVEDSQEGDEILWKTGVGRGGTFLSLDDRRHVEKGKRKERGPFVIIIGHPGSLCLLRYFKGVSRPPGSPECTLGTLSARRVLTRGIRACVFSG